MHDSSDRDDHKRRQNASAIQHHPTVHCMQCESHARKPARPRVLQTIATAAALGPKPPTNMSSWASHGDWRLTAADKHQHAHDQANVSTQRPRSGRRCSQPRRFMAGTRSAAF